VPLALPDYSTANQVTTTEGFATLAWDFALFVHVFVLNALVLSFAS
jgi:hypothetical protein